MPEKPDPDNLRSAGFHTSRSRLTEVRCRPSWFRRSVGPVAGGARRSVRRTLLLLLVAVFVFNSSRGQSTASRTSQVHVHLERAQAALRANDPETAVKEFHEVLTLDPKNAEAYANLGVIAFFQRDYQNASQLPSPRVGD